MTDGINKIYYTEAGRLSSFQTTQSLSKRRTSNAISKAPKALKWPHAWLVPEKLAEAGFFYRPTPESPDNVVCFLCNRSICGWEEDDDPFVEHLKLSPDCGWAIVSSIEAKDDSLSQENPLSSKMIEARKATFGDRWPHEGKKGWKCKVKQLVDAGWIYKPTSEDDDFAACVYCGLALDGWEQGDKPLDEHHNRAPHCDFFELRSKMQQSPAAKRTTKGRKPRASKVSRLSTQSTFTTTSEAPSFADLPAEEGDSVLTTATTATIKSQDPRKMVKGKKASAKGRKTRGKKDEPVEASIVHEPEDDDFEVKVDQPANLPSEKKRPSEAMESTMSQIEAEQPPAKRRATRTRGSIAIQDSLPITESSVDSGIYQNAVSDEQVVSKPLPRGRKGRTSNAKMSTQKASRTSNAAKASLRSTLSDDDEIDKMLKADLERPLPDEQDIGNLSMNGSKEYLNNRQGNSMRGSAAPIKRATRGSKILNKDHQMFSTDDMVVDDAAVEEELAAMELEQLQGPPKAKNAKGKQTRTVSAKQETNAKVALEPKMTAHVAIEEPHTDVLLEKSSNKPQVRGNKSRAIRTESHAQPSAELTLSVNESSLSMTSEIDELSTNMHEYFGNETDVSMASQSTNVKVGGGKIRGSISKKTNSKKKGITRNVEEMVKTIEVDSAALGSQLEETALVRVAKSKKLAHSKDSSLVGEVVDAAATNALMPPNPMDVIKAPRNNSTKPKGRGKNVTESTRMVQPDQLDEIQDVPISHHRGSSAMGALAQQSPKPALKDLTPSPSPQSSDAENHPPSSKQQGSSSGRLKIDQSGTSKIPLAVSTPSLSPSKRNIRAGLQSSLSWTNIDLDDIFLGSPGTDKENECVDLGSAVDRAKKGELTSPERNMTVEQWILFNARTAEDKLRGECERMVSIFEREGGRAMSVLEGLQCVD